MGHLFQGRKMLFAAAARVVKFNVVVVPDVGDVIGVKERTVESKLGEFVAVAKAAGLVADVASERDRFARRQGLFESIDGINIAGCRADQAELPIELEVRDRLLLVGNVNLRDLLAGLVLQSHADVSVEGAEVRIDIDGGVDGRDLGLEKVFILLEFAFVVGLDVPAGPGVEVFVEDVSVIEVPPTGAGGDEGEEQGERRKLRSQAKRLPETGAPGD